MDEDDQTLTLHTDTAWVSVESRQYSLFGIDLGEGIPRRKFGVGALIVAVWVIPLLIIGVPLVSKFGPAAYAIVPVLTAFFALRSDQSGRPQYVLWLDWARFQRRRHAPVIPRIGPPPQKRIHSRPQMRVLDLTTTKDRR